MSNVIIHKRANPDTDPIIVIRLDASTIATDTSCCCPTTPTLSCDQISASLTKCGTYWNGKFYLIKTCNCYGDGTDGTYTADYNVTSLVTWDPETCHTNVTCYGSGENTLPPELGGGNWNWSWANPLAQCLYESISDPAPEKPVGAITGYAGFACRPIGYLHTFGPDANCYFSGSHLPVSGEQTLNVTVTNEYTTDQLIAKTISNLPSYDGSYNDTCSASRSLSPDESYYSISRFNPRFTFSSATYDRTLTYDESGPDGVSSRSISVSSGSTQVDGNEVYEPRNNGTITITNIKLA